MIKQIKIYMICLHKYIKSQNKKRFLKQFMQDIKRYGLINGILQFIKNTTTYDVSVALNIPFTINKNMLDLKSPNIAVIVHMFYIDLVGEILGYLDNIPYQYDLFISTDTIAKKNEIEKILNLSYLGKFTVKVFPNRGRDIAPTYVGFAKVFNKYEYFLHIHTKKSLHKDAYSNWRVYMFDNLLGSTEVVQSIFELFARNNIGVVFPVCYKLLRHSMNWGGTYEMTQQLLSNAGIIIDNNTRLDFPAGSMFWARTSIVKKLIDLNFKFSDFEEECGQVNGTLAHAIERSILYFTEASGYTWVKVSAMVDDDLNDMQSRLTINEDNFQECFNSVYKPLLNLKV